MEITMRYGATAELVREFAPGTTVQDLLSNPQVKTGLRLPENVAAVVDGRTLQPHDELNDGDVVVFEKQAAQKAA